MNCEGNCINTHGEHKGNVVTVQVAWKDNWNPPHYFSYCENAIEEDKNRGFDVRIIKEEEEKV